MQLRPYQQQAKDKIYAAMSEYRRVMFQFPTGAGKTVVFSDIAKDFVANDKKVLTLAHRIELVEQAHSKFSKFGFGSEVGVIKAGYLPKFYAKVQIAMVQTLVRRERMLSNADFDLIIIDEAHHATAGSYKKICESYPNARILGVTATPIRTNGSGFEDSFDKLVKGASVSELIKDGYLAKPKVFASPMRFDLNAVKKTGGDYNNAALREVVEENVTYGDLVSTWKKRALGKRTVVFAVNIDHSESIVRAYQAAGINAAHIDGKTPENERSRILSRFAKGEIPILSNVGIVTEGFDVPEIECIQDVRPTASLGLYLQIGGRGMRPAAGKDSMIYLDHSNNVFTHGFLEQDRIWTLKGIDRKRTSQQLILIKDKKTGKTYEPKDLPENIKDIELVEISCDMVRIGYLEKLAKKCRKHKYKTFWIWFNFVKKYQIPTDYEIEYFYDNYLEADGYSSGWKYYAKADAEKLRNAG